MTTLTKNGTCYLDTLLTNYIIKDSGDRFLFIDLVSLLSFDVIISFNFVLIELQETFSELVKPPDDTWVVPRCPHFLLDTYIMLE